MTKNDPRELIIREVSGGTTEDGKNAVVIEFVDLLDNHYRLMLAGGDVESFTRIWGAALEAIHDMKTGKAQADKVV